MRMPYGIALTFLVCVAFAAEGNVDTVPMSFYADAELSKVTSLYQFVALSSAPYGIKISPEEFALTMSESKWSASEQKDDDRDKNAEGVYRHYLDGKDEMKTDLARRKVDASNKKDGLPNPAPALAKCRALRAETYGACRKFMCGYHQNCSHRIPANCPVARKVLIKKASGITQGTAGGGAGSDEELIQSDFPKVKNPHPKLRKKFKVKCGNGKQFAYQTCGKLTNLAYLKCYRIFRHVDKQFLRIYGKLQKANKMKQEAADMKGSAIARAFKHTGISHANLKKKATGLYQQQDALYQEALAPPTLYEQEVEQFSDDLN